MDLSKLDTRKKSNEGSFLHLKHPGTGVAMHDGCDEITGAGGDLTKPVGLYLLGKDSDKHMAYVHKRKNARIFAKDDVQNTSEQSAAETIEMLAEITTGWQHMELDGKKNLDRDLAVELYTRLAWAAEQATFHVVDRANFI